LLNAFGHPVWHVTEAGLNLLSGKRPNDDDGLPNDLRYFFTKICDMKAKKLMPGRMVLAKQLVFLFRVDRPWTEDILLSIFNWDKYSNEAKAAWSAFLQFPRVYIPLMGVIKEQFLSVAADEHFNEFGDTIRNQFVDFLTYSALTPMDGYKQKDFGSAFIKLSQKDLENVAHELIRILKDVGERREEYWKNRILPFWQHVWPQFYNFRSKQLAYTLARLSIETRSEFPSALDAIKYWLIPLDEIQSSYIAALLLESNLLSEFPEGAVALLNIVVDKHCRSHPKLKRCLDEILKAFPQIINLQGFKELYEYAGQ
jgi:hypothetical protein